MLTRIISEISSNSVKSANAIAEEILREVAGRLAVFEAKGQPQPKGQHTPPNIATASKAGLTSTSPAPTSPVPAARQEWTVLSTVAALASPAPVAVATEAPAAPQSPISKALGALIKSDSETLDPQPTTPVRKPDLMSHIQ